MNKVLSKINFKKSSIIKLLLSTLIFLVLLFDILNGSHIGYLGDSCIGLIDPHEIILICSILIYLISIKVNSRSKKILRQIALVLFIPGFILLLSFNTIDKYQMNYTSKQLEVLCNAINEFDNKEERIPLNLEELYPNYLSEKVHTGFGFWKNEINYSVDKTNFNIEYEIRYGTNCLAYNCNPSINIYTCTSCPDFTSPYFEKVMAKERKNRKSDTFKIDMRKIQNGPFLIENIDKFNFDDSLTIND